VIVTAPDSAAYKAGHLKSEKTEEVISKIIGLLSTRE
jgi:hypothetical protein